jgi:hypothetical protein
MAEALKSDVNHFYHCHRRFCFIKFILIICTIVFFTLSYVCFTKATLHLIDDNNNNNSIFQLLQCPYINQTRVEYGRKHFSQSRVIICGLLRDRESHIPRLKEQLSTITKFFADYAIVIVENDSKDGTRRELINWAKTDSHIHVIGCENQTNSIKSCNLSLPATKIRFLPETKRIEKMVRLRNIYLNYIDNHVLLNQFDYIIIEDFDLTSYTYINGLFTTGFYLNNDSNIDAICSNGIYYNRVLGNVFSYETYFDPYAHKDKDNQHWSMTYNDLWSSLFRKYSCNENLIPVQSCFSGRSIYRLKSIQGKRYRTYLDQNKQPVCEHVGLHETLNNMYLNSEMIFYILENNLIQK